MAEHGAPVAVIEAQEACQRKADHVGDFIRNHFVPWALAHQKAGRPQWMRWRPASATYTTASCAALSPSIWSDSRQRRIKEKIKPATVNRDLDRIRKVYSCAVEWASSPNIR